MVAGKAMAVRVIGERFDYPTVCNFTATANFDHALKFQFGRRKSGDALVDFVQAITRDLSDRITVLTRMFGQLQQVADRLLTES